MHALSSLLALPAGLSMYAHVLFCMPCVRVLLCTQARMELWPPRAGLPLNTCTILWRRSLLGSLYFVPAGLAPTSNQQLHPYS